MNVAPATAFEAVIDTGTTGLVGTAGVEANDNLGAVSIPFTSSGVAEIAPGVYAIAGLVAPTDQGQYTLIWRNGRGGPVLGVDDLTVTGSAPAEPIPPAPTYVDTDELFRVLKIRTPTPAQVAAGERVITVAAGEINSEIDRVTDLPAWGVQLCAEVNLERAVEHWQQQESPFGVIGLGEPNLVVTARDTWDRHAYKLHPLKESWGLS